MTPYDLAEEEIARLMRHDSNATPADVIASLHQITTREIQVGKPGGAVVVITHTGESDVPQDATWTDAFNAIARVAGEMGG